MVVGIALIPEAISFSVVAHVSPSVGLFASFTMAMTIAIVGGRPAMISAATGSTALVIAPLARAYGIHYLLAAVLLAGLVQIVLGFAGVAKLMRYVPRAVSVGFVNALGILLFKAQWPNLQHVPVEVYGLVGAGLLIIVLFPRVNRVIPPPLVAIIALTLLTTLGGMHGVPTVGDQGTLPHSLPGFGLPAVPLDGHTLSIIALPAVTMAIVGLLETQMTARRVDELTDTGSDKSRESWGQGIANVITSLFGGMGGCAMIGQTMINVKSGARTRASTFLAGAFLLVLVIVLRGVVAEIPMAALVAVMFVVSYSTFDWASIAPDHLRRLPRSETAVMLTTVAITVATGNLSFGVLGGVVLAALLFARRVQHVTQVTRIGSTVRRELHLHLPHLPHLHLHARPAGSEQAQRQAQLTSLLDPDGHSVIYVVSGELFFASTSDLADHFHYADDPDHVIIDFTAAHVWDASAIAALDQIVQRYRNRGKQVELVGLNDASSDLHANLTGRLAASH